MKFSNGCWLQKEGTECFSPAQFYFTSIEKDEVKLCAPTHHIGHRGDTLGGVNLTVHITSPAKGVLRIRVTHYEGVTDHGPHFDLNVKKNVNLDVKETDKEIIIKSGSLKFTGDKDSGRFVIFDGDKKLTSSGWRDMAYMKTDWKGLAYDDGGRHDTFMRQQLSLSVDEHIYGLGEHFTPFVKNGQSIDIWNADGGTSTEQSYKNIPFYISDRGYGVLVNHPEKVSFEIATEMVTKAEFSVQGESLDYFIFGGPTMKDVIEKYTDLTGKPSLPAPWTFGLWLSTSFTTNYDEKTVNSFVDGMFERGIPLAVFHFDCFWMKEFHWSDFKWDERVFPDPKGMISRMKKKHPGLKVCCWINSYIAQDSVLFKEGCEKGYFIKRTNGDVWQWDMWQPGMAIVDFTNPEACRWFAGKLEELIDMGVDCFKTDFGERIPDTGVTYFNGADPEGMHNFYTYLYNKTVYDLLVRKKGKKEAILFARSATVGGQKFPVHWGGDCWSDYESMEESLRGGLSLTLSGFGYWSHDIGGFENTSTADVYKRWCAFGLLSSHSRLHGSTSYRVPWVYDEEAVDVVRMFTKLKASLMPYLYRNAIETSKTGVPMMRAMVLEFGEDANCTYLDKQYMYGDRLLVSPIFNDESKAHYYLPEGKWTNYFTNEAVSGGRWINEKCGYLSIPLLVRENSIIATGKDTGAVYDYADGVKFSVYELTDGVKAHTDVFDGDAKLEVTADAIKKDGKITLDVDSKKAKPFTVLLVNVYNVKSVKGAKAKKSESGTLLIPEGNGKIVVTL